jgi:hypothetical protein
LFEVIPQTHDRHIVIPDQHGEFELTRKIIDSYFDNEDIGFVFLGDVIDKSGVSADPERGVFNELELIRQLGSRAILTIANHEWYPLAAIYEKDPAHKEAHTTMWLGLGRTVTQSVSAITLANYGITERDETTPQRFLEALQVHGHDKVLTAATPYFETDTFIATHAGIERDIPFDEQKAYLEQTARDMAQGTFNVHPTQWFSIELSVDARPVTATDKVVISGHAHGLDPKTKTITEQHIQYSPERSLHGGKRIRLASRLNPSGNEDGFIWQDWDGQIIQVARSAR